MAKLQTGVPSPAQPIGQIVKLDKTSNKNLEEFKDGYLVQMRRQHADDIGANGKPFARRYNVAYVDAQGNEHLLLEWSINYKSATPDKVINMILQDQAQLKRLASGKVSSSITKKQQKSINNTTIEKLLEK